jgi:hypothetical protein
MEEEEKEDNIRVFVLLIGAIIFFTILCCGCRQLALLEQRIDQLHRYNRLEQELIELTEADLEEFDSEDDEDED